MLSLDGNFLTYLAVMAVAFVLFYFFMNYQIDKSVDEKLAKTRKKIVKQIQNLYKRYNNQDEERARMEEAMRHREMMMMRQRSRQQEDSDEDSIEDAGFAPSGSGGGNFASFNEDDDE